MAPLDPVVRAWAGPANNCSIRAPIKLGELFAKALTYAFAAHRTQIRKGTDTPYIAHLLGVAALVIEDGGDEEQAVAALRHDAMKDQGGRARLEDIRANFG
jgi:(p)ppGpp synthase/HD superfamily hydrolase